MNHHVEKSKKFAKFAEYNTKFRPMITPCWFNTESNVLLVKFGETSSLYSSFPKLGHIRYIAVYMGIGGEMFVKKPSRLYTTACYPWVYFRTAMPMHIFYVEPFWPNLTTLTFLLPLKCEVIVVTIDETTNLKSGDGFTRWSYSSDTESIEHRVQMSERWSSVTWQVKFVRNQQVPGEFPYLLRRWMLDHWTWEQAKR
jgi:hypothetical protein